MLQWFVDFLSANYAVTVATLSPVEAVMNIMQLTLLLMLIVCLPLILLFIISYVRPALYEHEQRLLFYVPISFTLGLAGSVFGWFLAIKIFIPYFDSFSHLLQLHSMWSLNYLTGFVITNLLIFFLIFQVPLLVVVLHSLNILKVQDIGRLRRMVVLASVIIGAIVTPPDVISQLVVALPFYLLFELSIQYCRYKEWRTAAKAVCWEQPPKAAGQPKLKKPVHQAKPKKIKRGVRSPKAKRRKK
ncbi:twin arginine-targeting protein translocase TatC [Candidatus Termititenax aidoneus]|uniref:Twin arginine-targeting protein translocase TatC n=1 Tax=Termititenax aidoneus TaxID=2218524 RepID=A0A388T8Q4_TERA1|nr:twin arginine-targeting protein translocase TatC [Candidatus Termititenax aidoneus]